MNRKLKAKIVEKFGTQFEFSKAINEHESNISRVIRGRRELNEEDKKAWAKILEMDINELFNIDSIDKRIAYCPHCREKLNINFK